MASFIGSLTTIKGAALAVGTVLAGLTASYYKLIQAASQQQDADVKLAVALASIGQNTAATRAHLEAFAAQMEDVTTVNVQAIQGVLALFVQLGHLSGEGLEQATRAALNYSAAMGSDVNETAEQMINVLARGSGRLRGINTDFDVGTTNAEKYASVLKQMTDLTEGVAAEMGQTFSASLRRVSNDFDDMLQADGKVLVENDALKGGLQALSTVFKDLGEFVKTHNQLMNDMATIAGKAGIVIIRTGVELASFGAQIAEAYLKVGQLVTGIATLAATAPYVAQKILGIKGANLDTVKSLGAIYEGLGKFAEGAHELGTAADGTVEKINALLASLSKGGAQGHDPAAGFKNVTGAANQATDALSAFNEILKALNIETVGSMDNVSKKVSELLSILPQMESQGLITKEQYDAILDSVMKITAQLPDWSTDMSAARQHAQEVHSVMMDIYNTAEQATIPAAQQLGDALIDTAFGAKIAWGQFFRQVLADFAKAIERMLIWKGLMAIFNLGSGGAAGAFSDFGSAGFGGVGGGGIGVASIGLQPAQLVAPGLSAAAMGVSLSPAAGVNLASKGDFVMPVTILPARDRTAEAVELLEEMSNLVERKGFRLVASQVLG